MIEKKDLEEGEYYVGSCRNSHVAKWDGKVFIYLRYKFGDTFAEEIDHAEDGGEYDVFIPIRHLDTTISDDELEQIYNAEQKYT